MKKTLLKLGLAPTIVLALTLMSNSGGSPGGRTGSSSDGQTCATAGCHGAIPPNGQDMISTNIPAEGYMADSTYQISVTVTDANSSKFGFEMTVEDASGSKQGSFTGNTDVTSYNSNQRVTHKSSSNSGSGSRTWTMDWTAPSSGAGSLTFYVAALVANGNGNNSGDFVLTDSRQFMEQITASHAKIEAFDMKIYPNPTQDYIQIDGLNGQFQISIFDKSGKLVMESDADRISLETLSTGSYVVKVRQGNIVRSQIVLKH